MNTTDAHLKARWSAHELVFTGLSWPTTRDEPFWLDAGTLSSSSSLTHGWCNSCRAVSDITIALSVAHRRSRIILRFDVNISV